MQIEGVFVRVSATKSELDVALSHQKLLVENHEYVTHLYGESN